MVGGLLLQTGLKGWTEECTIPNWAVCWGAAVSAAGEKQSAGLCITCVERLIVPIASLCFRESIKCGCCCMD